VKLTVTFNIKPSFNFPPAGKIKKGVKYSNSKLFERVNPMPMTASTAAEYQLLYQFCRSLVTRRLDFFLFL
jgi:hypothetical protein